MVRQIFGYTLLELMVVLGIIGIIAVMVFYGIKSFGQGQAVLDAQRGFVNNLRGMQNQINNGADGESVKRADLDNSLPGSYSLQTTGDNYLTVNLPSGVALSYDSVLYPGPISICFSNPNLSVFDNAHFCGSSTSNPCKSGVGYLCDRSGTPTAKSPASGSISINFTQGLIVKKVVVEGSGMQINRIYGQ